MAELLTLETPTCNRWRAWLEKHHAASPGVWLVFHKGHTRKGHTRIESISYEDSVREALRFGWIDSLIKRLDDDRYARKFTPRQPASKWSAINRKRWTELKAAGLLTEAGLAAAPTGNKYAPPPVVPYLPDYIAQALQANPEAWTFFEELPPSQQRYFVLWIHSAKRAETREKRIRESLALLASRQRLGLK